MSGFSRWPLVIAAILVVVVSHLFWQEHREVLILREEKARAGEVSRHVAKVRSSVQATPLKIESTDLAPDIDGAAKTPAADAARPLFDSERQIRAQLLQYKRWMRLSKKTALLAAMNLPPDKLGPFKDLLVERDYAETDARDAAGKAGIEPNSSEATEAAASAMENVDQRIRALLGEADFAKYSEQVGLGLFRDDVAQSTMVGYFVDAGVPLTAEQETGLAVATYRTFLIQSQNYSGQPEEPDPTTGFKPSQKAILDHTARLFSTAQIELLRNFFLNDNRLGASMNTSSSRRVSR